jgi:TP901 family phage tail tape measure protein
VTFPVGSLTAFLSVKGAAAARADIASVRQAMAETGATADGAAIGLDRVDVALAGTARASLNASSSASRLRVSQLQQVAAVERYNKVLADESATLGQVARAEAALIRANERVTASTPVAGAFKGAAAGAEQAAAATSRFSGAMASTIGMAKQLGLLFGAVEIVKKAIDITKEANAFQQNMLLIQTNANASADEMKNMSAAVLKLAPQVGTGPVELAQALYHVEQNGLRGQAALEALTVGAQGAKIGMADVEDTTNTMTIALASGITGMGNMEKAMGTMIAIAGTGDMRLKDLNEALSGGILSIAKGYGATLGDVAAVLATLGDNGIRGADAATALRQTMMGFAQPAAKGADALASVGLAMHDLRDDMEQHGLVHAMNDLEQHMQSAGVTGAKVGGFITEAFGKRAGAGLAVLMGELDRVNVKFDEGAKGGAMFMTKWQQTTTTAAFAFDRLKAGFESAGVSLAEKLQPALATAGTFLANELPHAIATIQGFLKPLEHELGVLLPAAWGLLIGAAKVALAVLKPIGEVLSDIKGPLTTIGVVALGAWAAFKGVELVQAMVVSLGIVLKGAALNVIDFGAASVAGARGFLGIGGAATVAAADVAAASTVIAVSADGVATVVVADAETAAVAWTTMLGPLAAVGVGVGLLVSMFHRSSGASKEATAAAKAYTEALKSGTDADLSGAILKQLADNKVSETLAALNKSLGTQAVTGTQFFNAIKSGGAPLAALRTQLEGIIKAGTTVSVTTGRGASATMTQTAAAKAATKALSDLNSQYSGLTDAAKKDLLDSKTFGIAAASIDQVSQTTQVATKVGQQYAEMLGFQFNQNGITNHSSKDLAAAINTVTNAYANATQTGDQFLSALSTFSSSAGTASDRAALIGATLKAANGDALNYVGAMASAVDANRQMVSAFQQQSQQLTSQSTDQKNAQAAVSAAQKRVNELRADAKTKASTLASAENTLTKAQQAAAQAGVLAIGDTEKAAINLKTGMIDASKAGAGPLVQQLQAIQSAAMAAAQAMFQHEVATKHGKTAADDAYKVYVNQTRGQLIDNAKQLGISTAQAKLLADQYFGMPKDVKTSIESEGTDPILTVLTKIGKLLAAFTGQPWDVNTKPAVAKVDDLNTRIDNLANRKATPYVSIEDRASATLDKLLAKMGALKGAQIVAKASDLGDLHDQAYATGGTVGDGYFTAGERGPEIGYKSGSHVQFFPNEVSSKMAGAIPTNTRAAAKLDSAPQMATPVKQFVFSGTIVNPLRETAEESFAVQMTRMAMLAD